MHPNAMECIQMRSTFFKNDFWPKLVRSLLGYLRSITDPIKHTLTTVLTHLIGNLTIFQNLSSVFSDRHLAIFSPGPNIDWGKTTFFFQRFPDIQ